MALGKVIRHSRTACAILAALGLVPVTALADTPAAHAETVVTTTIIDSQTDLCLDSNYSNPAYPANGAVYTDPCNGGTFQDWSLSSIPNTQSVTITDVQTGLCLESNFVNPAVPATGKVYTEGCTGGTAQDWAVDTSPNGDASFCDDYTGLCLDSNYTNPAYPATGAVYTDPANGGTFQSWIYSILPQFSATVP